MRILFLLPEFPYPPSTGGRSKVFNELVYLSENHKCDLLCFGDVTDAQMTALTDKLPNVTVCGVIAASSGIKKRIKVIWSLLRLLPPSLSKYASDEYTSVLTKLLSINNYDVVHYDIVNMAQYLPIGKCIASVHSPNDATSLSYLRMAEQENRILRKMLLLMSSVLLKRFEKKYYPLFTKVHVVSPIDAGYLKEINKEIDLDVIPITIDNDFLSKVDNRSEYLDGGNSHKTIICTGNFNNASIARGFEEFLLRVYPLILIKLPQTKLLVLGQNVDDLLIMLMEKMNGVEFITWVENYRDFLIQGDVVLAPDLAGTGIKTRVIQAMGLGLPVIGTAIAFEGIPITDRVHGFVYESSAQCADIFIKLLSNNNEREEVGEQAHLFAKEKFSLSAIGPRYENLYLSALEKHNLLGSMSN